MSDINVLVGAYVRCRDSLAAARKEFKQLEQEHKKDLDAIERKILQLSDEQGVLSFKTEHGTAFKQTKTLYNIKDWDIVMDFVIQNDMRNFLQHRLSNPAVAEYVAENDNQLPPGVDPYVQVGINVRRS